ncbi:hypothetical protein RHMOL_Rhmol09G0186700 [Rhododendron molle]|uniref:Uncharacterized protein n=1 Tax=Rhododendron molle TaxID=49168 RepID=A0ACC0MFY3_RHOML|nr:hypothetical protein RHMOL_Rhmol09G0186700 [Rhododendron molle]
MRSKPSDARSDGSEMRGMLILLEAPNRLMTTTGRYALFEMFSHSFTRTSKFAYKSQE